MAAVQEYAGPQSVGAVPSSGQDEIAAASPGDSLPHGSDTRNLSLCDVENTALLQPSVGGYSNASGYVTLPDRSCLPIRYLKGKAARIEGIGVDTALGTPSDISLGRIVSPEYRDLVAPTLEAVRQAKT